MIFIKNDQSLLNGQYGLTRTVPDGKFLKTFQVAKKSFRWKPTKIIERTIWFKYSLDQNLLKTFQNLA